LRDGGTKLITLGGDHTIALPLLRSLHRDHGPIAVLHFDAHLDTWDTYFGAPFTHGTPFRRASEEGLLDPEHCLHVGIRGPLYASTDLSDDRVLGFQVIGSDDVQLDGLPAVIERMRARLGDAPVYVSVDIDVLDPAHAPGTDTPEAGGMTPRTTSLLAKPGGRESRRRRHRGGRTCIRPRRDHRYRRRACRVRTHVCVCGQAMTEHRNGGAAVVETLAAHGVDTIFGIPGTHNLEMYRHFPTTGIRAVTPRHEQGAGYAAEAYARVTGRPGVVVATSGPGLTNTMTAATTGYAESQPILILSSGMPTGAEGQDLGQLHEAKNTSAAMDQLVRWSLRVRDADEAPRPSQRRSRRSPGVVRDACTSRSPSTCLSKTGQAGPGLPRKPLRPKPIPRRCGGRPRRLRPPPSR
jgi:hypothetical protein